ncbi:hypothetical protein like AT3G29340 [Hibiscus trionum]|uniref:C2H2-type domain-containing protein n=1 Tax=Hibiscus trionum TaxID=183268 RepID=A0A9W7IBP6_HIBTR|nr:hypothetical protein like AT3G29340 [Hibiscus trionum]
MEAPQESRLQLCIYCRKGFTSSKALYGHLRIHSTQARSKTRVLRINSPKRETKRPHEEDECFGCLVCNESFSSTRLLCQHMKIHRQAARSRKPSRETSSKTAWDDDIIYDAVPLRFYYGEAYPHMETSKKKKIEDTPTEEVGADSESTVVEQIGNWFETHDSNKSGGERRSAVKSVHQCDICGKTFAKGQALGGHKTSHRVKDPFKVKFVWETSKQEPCGEVKEYVTEMLLPGLMPEEVRPKKMLDFDLNIPYEE